MNYYNTYYFANVIYNVVMRPFGFIRNFDEFYQVGLTVPVKFSKDSNLHEFIRFVIDGIFEENLRKECDMIDDNELMAEPSKIKPFWINRALSENGFTHKSFQEWLEENQIISTSVGNTIDSYVYEYLYDPYQELLRKLAIEVFHILFLNREFLLEFNSLVSVHISFLRVDEDNTHIPGKLKRDGVLYRADIPAWVKDAVFFRDRGHCVFCNSNLTNLVSRLTVKNFDHMIPLNLSGGNDVSNIQLTCESCNLKKSGSEGETSKTYELWYRQ
ncbi:HNH endonuclease [Paenibacillus xylanexedens]|uniref:HNH endonuclease n=1 Tax=Paenibacillus xylanexedens TaxID=528191 RepID=UPI003B02DF6E